MAVKLIILGRPGSGKSAAARCIYALAQNYGWLLIRINDYKILYDLFQEEQRQADTEQKKFRAVEHEGFEVLDSSVLDIALKDVEDLARNFMAFARNFLLIEFARDDYREALKQFNSDLLQEAYFLFIHSDVDTCIQRIQERIAHPATSDDVYVSSEVMRRYYQFDNRPFMLSNFAKEYTIPQGKVKVINNTGTLKGFHREVYEFVETILEQESYILRETEPMPALPSLMSEAAHSKVAMSEQVSDAGNI